MNVIKLPYSVTRRSHARKPRRSKNGTPEQRAATAVSGALAPVVAISAKTAAAPDVGRFEYLGALKFPAQTYDLTSIPNNERAGQDAAAMMPWIRLSALFLCQDDEQLEANVRSTGNDGMGEWVETLENIGAVLDAKRQDAEMLEAGFTRLLVVIERVLGKADIERAYGVPSDGDTRVHLANIRARLLRRRATWEPKLVTGDVGGQS